MCRVLLVNRSTYYYEAKQKSEDPELSSEIIEIFKASRNNYETRKIKRNPAKTGKPGFNYTTAQLKPHKDNFHSSLGYQTPVQYKKNNLKKVV